MSVNIAEHAARGVMERTVLSGGYERVGRCSAEEEASAVRPEWVMRGVAARDGRSPSRDKR